MFCNKYNFSKSICIFFTRFSTIMAVWGQKYFSLILKFNVLPIDFRLQRASGISANKINV